MPVYSYRLKDGSKFYCFKCCIRGHQYLRRSFRTREEAVSAETGFRVSKGGNVKDVTFSKAMDAYVGWLSLKEKQSSLYCFGLRRKSYFSKLPDVSLNRLDFSVLYPWFSGLGVTPGVSQRILSDLKGFFDFAEVYFGIRNVEYKKLFVPKDYSIPSKPHLAKFILSLDDFHRFYLAVDDSYWSFLFLFEFVTGLRVGELVGLQLSCIDSDKHSVFIRQQSSQHSGKGRAVITSPKSRDSIRTILLPDFLWNRYCSFVSGNRLSGDDFLFFGEKKSIPVSINTVYRWLTYFQEKAGIVHFKFHSFRKSEASLLNDQGISGDVIKDYMGHDSFETTKEYYIGDSEKKKEDVRDILQDKIGSVIGK